MRCKHENADHVMDGESIPPYGAPYAIAACEQLRCLDCGAWLSLGPSAADSDAVRIEILAAFLVSHANAFVNVAHLDEHQLDFGSFREDCIGCQAEHLAWNVIAAHDEKGREA